MMSDNNISITSANVSLILLAEPVLPLVTFSQADFEMQNAVQFCVPEDQNDNSIVESRAGRDPTGSVTPFSSSRQDQLC